MLNELLTETIKHKLKITNTIMNNLPPVLQDHIEPIYKEVLDNIHNVTGELIVENTRRRENSTLNNVKIE